MSSLFAFIRQDLRAALIASLLVLSHALLLTASKAPQETRTDDLISALGTISALISVTILWVAFTILEAADSIRSRLFGERRSAEDEEEDEDRFIFCTTWIELALGLGLLACWLFHRSQAGLIMSAFASSRTSGLVLIRVAYTVGVTSLGLLQLHLILSILWHAFWQGGVMQSSFWNERTGWWVGVGRIRLGDKSDRDLETRMQEKV